MITKNSFFTFFYLIILILHCKTAFAQNENWTHFRGNNLDGIAEPANIPVKFDVITNLKWKTDIPGRGWSSPVIYDNQIWMTTASTDGKELFAVCLDFESGNLLYNILLFTPDSIIRKHSINSYATPSPCIEKDFVYAHFGSLGTACINTSSGKIVWSRADLKCDHLQGPGSSPILYKDFLILHYDGTDVRFLVALNKSTGEIVWKAERPEEAYTHIPNASRKAYITPLLINVDGRDMLISNGAGICSAYDPLTGEEIWRVVRGDGGTIAMPFYEKGHVFFYTGMMAKEDGKKFTELLAVNPKGRGDITSTHILWRKEAEILQLLTPVIKDDLIYTIDSNNILMCIDAITTDVIWSMKLRDKFNSSPVFTNGNIYFSSISGEVLVIKEGRELNILARNQMDGEIWATPAILRNSLLLRTDSHLYRIGY